MTSFDGFKKTKDYLICVDSDGCVMDSMSVKHIECFGPAMVEEWNLREFRADALRIWNEVNLYTATRAINRFKGLDIVLNRINQEYCMIDGIEELDEWCSTAKRLSNPSLEEAIAKTDSPMLSKALAWSNEVNHRVYELSDRILPFKGAEKGLQKASEAADIVVVSSANPKAVLEEWGKHGLDSYPQLFLCQDAGPKEYCISEMLKFGYDVSQVLVLGDAPGDSKAAASNGVCFYPINVNHEVESWKEFSDKAVEVFVKGEYESYGQTKLKEFLINLGITQ